MLYCCGECGKTYNTEEEALDCEKAHAEEKAKREQLSKAKSDREKEVDGLFKTFYDAYKSFYNDYGTFPEISGGFNKINPFDRLFSFMF